VNNRPASIYTTPYLVDQQLQRADIGGAGTAIATEYDTYYAYLLTDCRDSSKIIEERTNSTFVPYYEAKEMYFAELVRSRSLYIIPYGLYVLKLEDDLLACSSLVINATAMTVGTQYRLTGVNNKSNTYPYRHILIDTAAMPAWDTDFATHLTVTGEWGVQDNASDAYTTVGVLAAVVTDTTTTSVRVANAALYHVYEYIRIDAELMLITATDTTTTPHTLTVTRGVNGFTAATHLISASITRWNVVRDVQKLATRMVAYAYQKRADTGERIQIVDNTAFIAQFSEEIAEIAERRTFIQLEPG
jgi:hypothetical protein